MTIEELAYEALREVKFSIRFKQLAEKFNNSKGSEVKIKKSEIVSIFKQIGFNFKYIDSCYILEEPFVDYKFMVIFDFRYNTVLCSFYLYYKDALINLQPGHFTFLRNYLEGIEEFIAPYYTTINDLSEISKEVLSIYEDFKAQFFHLIEGSD